MNRIHQDINFNQHSLFQFGKNLMGTTNLLVVPSQTLVMLFVMALHRDPMVLHQSEAQEQTVLVVMMLPCHLQQRPLLIFLQVMKWATDRCLWRQTQNF